MTVLNRWIAGGLGALLTPFQGLIPLAGLTFISLLTAVFVLLVYRKTSNQEGITAVRRRIVASLLEMRLFRDDLLVVLRAQGQVVRASLRYFGYSLVPLAWILLPLVVLFVHLDRVYGYDPLEPGESAIVTVRARDVGDLHLEAGSGIAVETPSLRRIGSGEADWRIRGLTPGEHLLRVQGAGREVTKRVMVGVGPTPLASTRPSSGILDELFHPGEAPLPRDAPVQAITVGYRRADVAFLGWRMNWVIPFLGLTIVFGFTLQRPLGVKL